MAQWPASARASVGLQSCLFREKLPVLDRRYVADNVDLIIANCCKRGSPADVARFAELDRLRRSLQADIDSLNQQAGVVSKSIGKAADPAGRESLKAWRAEIPGRIGSGLGKGARRNTRCIRPARCGGGTAACSRVV